MTARVFPPSAQTPTPTVESTVVRNPDGSVVLDAANGVFPFSDASVVALTITADPAGACTIQPAATCTSTTIQAAQASSGAGKQMTVGGSQGASGQTGGILSLQGGKAGTPGTGTPGAVYVDLGQVNSGGTSAKLSLRSGDPASSTEFLSIGKSTSFPGGLIQAAAGVFAIQGTPNIYVRSTDESVGTLWNQNDGSMTHTATYVEHTGQISSATQFVAISAAPAFNCNLGNHLHIGATITTKNTANATIAAPSNVRAGAFYSVRIISNGTNTFAWNVAYKFAASGTGINQWGAGVPADGKITNHLFLCTDGTNLECVASSTI